MEFGVVAVDVRSSNKATHGRRAKAVVALSTLRMTMGCASIARSVLQDFLSNETAQESLT